MTLYIDIILIENLIMNYIILYATSVIAKTAINRVRIIISSFIGAIYAIIEYVLIDSIYSNFILKLLLSVIIVYIAFKPQDLKKMCKQMLLFYLTSFVFGGVATYLIYTIKPQKIIIKNGMYVGTYVLKILVIGAIVGYIIVTIAFKLVKNKITKNDMFCKIKIKIEGKELILDAMVDTGNMLKEPISGWPVIVVEKNCLYELIPKEILDNIERILKGDTDFLLDELKLKYIPKFKIIPFSSLGKENGILLGLKVNELFIIDNDEERNIGNAVIGIYSKALTKRNEYNALIGLEV